MMHHSVIQSALCLLVSFSAAALGRFKRFYVQMIAATAMMVMFRAAADDATWPLVAAAAVWVSLSFFPSLREAGRPPSQRGDRSTPERPIGD
jgi:hypothetical protein